MTADEKKHFILDIIVNTTDKTRFDTSFIASVLGLNVSEVNNLCRELISLDDLKDSSSKDNVGTLTVVCFTQGADSFNTSKYLHLNSIDNIEFEILNFLYNKSTSTRTRINHILVSSSLTVFETTEILKNMVEAKLIQMHPQPLDLRYTSDNKLIDNHVLAFENIHRPINANITHEGKTYFKQQYMDQNGTTINDNSIKVGGDFVGNLASHSSFEKSDLKTKQHIQPNQYDNAKSQNSLWLIASKMLSYILHNIVQLLIAAIGGIIAGYFISKFGWTH